MPRYHDPFGGTGEVATSRRDERSGLLDIRALSSIVDAQRRAQVSSASASSVALPTFTSGWGLRDVSAPPPAPARTAPTVRAVTDQRPLYAMIVALSTAVAGLAAYVVLRPTPPREVVIDRVAVAVPAEAAPEPEPARAEPEPEPEPPVAAVTPPEEESAEPEGSEPETRSKRPRATRSPRTPKPQPKPQPVAKPPKGDGVIPVECVIDPSKCTKSGRRKDPIATDGTSTKGLPVTPSQSQIRSAMNAVKPQAKACRSRHGGGAGDKVRVKLSVEGSTGRITSAKPLDDHAGTALGRCVADALGKATLPRFSKPQVGVVYAVTL